MRKVKLEVTAKVPSWHFCNSDKSTLSLKVSSELCKFCCKDKHGYRCTLYDAWLTADRGLVNKAPACIEGTTWGVATITHEELLDTPKVEPRQIAASAIDEYIKTLAQLQEQGYPPKLAESVAKQYVLGG